MMKKFMKYAFYGLLTVIIISCSSKSSNKLDDLLAIDSLVENYSSLNQFTNFCVSRKSINDTAVCDSIGDKCRQGEQHYTTILDKIGVPVDTFDSITKKLCKIGFKTYYRHGDFSIWVEDGAFGDIYGYIINHNPTVSEVKSFELNKRYHVGIGEEVRENVYYFSSNFE